MRTQSGKDAGMRIVLILIALLLVPAVRIVCSQGEGKGKEDEYVVPPWGIGRIFSVSTESPLKRVIQETDRGIAALHELQLYFQRFANDLEVNNIGAQSCNVRDEVWGDSVFNFLKMRGLEAVDNTCIIEKRAPTRDIDSIKGAIRNFKDVMHEVKDSFASLALGNWSVSYVSRDLPVVIAGSGRQKCTVDNIVAIRFDGKWYLEGMVTNDELDRKLEAFQRQYLAEIIRAASTSFMDSSLKLAVYVRNTTEHITFDRLNGTTTVLSSWTGSPQPDTFGTGAWKNAVMKALEQGDLQAQQIEDVLQPSNLAILILPLIMNFVPAALIGEVNAFGMWMYILLTDVLTAIPLAIKGVEVIAGAKSESAEAYTRFTGVPNDDAVAEVFVAECQLGNSLLATGVAFLTVALSLMIAGIALEIISRWYRRRKYTKLGPGLSAYGAALASTNVARTRGFGGSRSVPLVGTGDSSQDKEPCQCSCHFCLACPCNRRANEEIAIGIPGRVIEQYEDMLFPGISEEKD